LGHDIVGLGAHNRLRKLRYGITFAILKMCGHFFFLGLAMFGVRKIQSVTMTRSSWPDRSPTMFNYGDLVTRQYVWRNIGIVGMLFFPVVGRVQDRLGNCTTDLVPGIQISVRDTKTGKALPPGLRVYAQDGAFVDTFVVVKSDSLDHPIEFSGVRERAGVYQVIVEHPKYRIWRKSSVVVKAGSCHVNTIKLNARLRMK
jgi:hypothetical protein